MKLVKVRIIHPVPSFICPIRYTNVGPFDKGEIVSFPERVADLLIRKRRARELTNPFSKWEEEN